MYLHQLNLRVRYAETDKMGYVYYGNYATYFEVARVEALRSLNISYRSLEEEGIIMPVLEHYHKYYKPAFYDDMLEIEVRIEKMPSVKIRFDYKVLRDGQLLGEAYTTLVFVETHNGRPIAIPAQIHEALAPYYK